MMDNKIPCYRVDIYDPKESSFDRVYFYHLGFASDFTSAVNQDGYVEAQMPVSTSVNPEDAWRIRSC